MDMNIHCFSDKLPAHIEALKASTFRDCPAEFSRDEFAGRYGLPAYKLYLRNRWIIEAYNPRTHDPFEGIRGEMYNPDHGLNLITGFPKE
jgi:hypothetical protein